MLFVVVVNFDIATRAPRSLVAMMCHFTYRARDFHSDKTTRTRISSRHNMINTTVTTQINTQQTNKCNQKNKQLVSKFPKNVTIYVDCKHFKALIALL